MDPSPAQEMFHTFAYVCIAIIAVAVAAGGVLLLVDGWQQRRRTADELARLMGADQ